MGRLIAIVGVSGIGKTTLVNLLAAQTHFEVAPELHVNRPFQPRFKLDKQFAFANQMDYLVFRAEQEVQFRHGDKPALVDGGLDLDFHGFTRLFHARGWLKDDEFELCHRFYTLTRSLLPLPDLVIALKASEQVIGQRLAARNRINIVSEKDTLLLRSFINEWVASIPDENILKLDVTHEALDYKNSLKLILRRV